MTIATGEVLTPCKARHRHQEFLSFLRHIDANVAPDLDVHLVLDSYATHKHPTVRAWLAARPRYHVHYTPTYSSWLNQVERWFGYLSQQAIKRGSFRTTRELIQRIKTFVDHDNTRSHPFAWTATADSILAKLDRLLQAISGTRHWPAGTTGRAERGEPDGTVGADAERAEIPTRTACKWWNALGRWSANRRPSSVIA